MKILFAGTPEFALPSLETVARGHDLAGVLTNPDRPAGRGRRPDPPPVGRSAQRLGRPVFQPVRLDAELHRRVADLGPDLLVVVAFGTIFRREFLDLFPMGGINVHASLLPRWRGPSPITAAILAGDRETGVTVQRLAMRMDAGEVLGVERVPLDGSETTATLSLLLAERGAVLLDSVLAALRDGGLQGLPQREEDATYCRILHKEDGKIDWGLEAGAIERMVRAYDPWPRAWTTWRGEALNILEARVAAEAAAGGRGAAGTAVGVDKRHGILVQTGEGMLGVRRLQLQARKPLDWRSFLNGHGEFIGSPLGG